MSSIVGFINLDREPADQELLLRLCRPLENRSPDGTTTWRQGHVGLGHGMLRISAAECAGRQPCSFNNSVWITSDEHIYGKEDLIRKLVAAGLNLAENTTDPEILLLAYATFGDEFAKHLIGDFAIAIWDEKRQTLICVRDHLGVRPLFYAQTNGTFVFGSDIDSILEHPNVSDELNETFIADFLLFGGSIENEATIYKQIKRLPASHYLKVGPRGFEMHRYWSPSSHNTIRYSDVSEYTEHFRSVFEQAVTSRVPDGHVAMELSGGMDSSSIAAVLVDHSTRKKIEIAAYTNTCRTLIPADKEKQFVKITSAYLNLPVKFVASEDFCLFERFEHPFLRTQEPFGNPGLAQYYDKAKELVDSGCRVLLTGQMADALFASLPTFYLHLIKTGQIPRLMIELSTHYKNVGSLSGTGLGSAVRRLGRGMVRKPEPQPEIPIWLNKGFARRISFEDRWTAQWRMWDELNDTHGQLRRPWISQVFESHEALKLPLLVRHPFSDIRLVELMLAVPSFLHSKKRLLREAMREKLPPEILSRPKEGLPGDLVRTKMRKGLACGIPSFDSVSEYIDKERFSLAYDQFVSDANDDSTWNSWLINHPIALAYWMNNNNR